MISGLLNLILWPIRAVVKGVFSAILGCLLPVLVIAAIGAAVAWYVYSR